MKTEICKPYSEYFFHHCWLLTFYSHHDPKFSVQKFKSPLQILLLLPVVTRQIKEVCGKPYVYVHLYTVYIVCERSYSSSRLSCLRIRAFFLFTSVNHSWISLSSSSRSLPLLKRKMKGQFVCNCMGYWKKNLHHHRVCSGGLMGPWTH